jgi:hypothetical protein
MLRVYQQDFVMPPVDASMEKKVAPIEVESSRAES